LPLLRSGGLEAVVIFGGELEEGGLGFAADELGFGVDAGFEGVHRGTGLAFIGARTGGFLRVESIGCELFLSRHRRRG
jgi:hypothetical protein